MLSADLLHMIKHSRNSLPGNPNERSKLEIFNVMAMLTVEDRSHRTINLILLHEENCMETK